MGGQLYFELETKWHSEIYQGSLCLLSVLLILISK